MIKFIYPLSSNVTKKRSAWRNIDRFTEQFEVQPSQPRLREETFLHATLLDDTEGQPICVRQRVYTFTFHPEASEADVLIRKLNTVHERYARKLTSQTMLLCLDNDLGVRSDRD